MTKFFFARFSNFEQEMLFALNSFCVCSPLWHRIKRIILNICEYGMSSKCGILQRVKSRKKERKVINFSLRVVSVHKNVDVKKLRF